jgi:hypothetical protein
MYINNICKTSCYTIILDLPFDRIHDRFDSLGFVSVRKGWQRALALGRSLLGVRSRLSVIGDAQIGQRREHLSRIGALL